MDRCTDKHAAYSTVKLGICSFNRCCWFTVNNTYEELAMSCSLLMSYHRSLRVETTILRSQQFYKPGHPKGWPRDVHFSSLQLGNVWRLHKSQARLSIRACKLQQIHDAFYPCEGVCSITGQTASAVFQANFIEAMNDRITLVNYRF